MRAFFTRRVIIALVSGLLTLAIVAGIALAYNLQAVQRDSQALATPTSQPYTYSVTATPTMSAPAPTATPAPSKSKGGATTPTSVSAPPTHGGRAATSATVASDTPTPTSGGGGSPTPGASPTATPTTTIAGPTATPMPPTPTATAAPLFDGASVAASSGQKYGSYGWITVPVTMTNTGTTTWEGPGIYYLRCLSTCLGDSSENANGIAPGSSVTLNPMFDIPWPFTSATYHSTWSMSNAGVSFGQTVKITITATTSVVLGVDPAPGCDSAGMSWSLSGGASCANGGLLLTTNSAHEPQALMTSGPSGMDTSNYLVTFDASFSAMNQAWVRVAYYSGGNEQGMDVEPGGKFRTFTIYNGVESDGLWTTLNSFTSPSFSATIGSLSYGYTVYINHGYMGDGGTRVAGGMPVVSVGGANGVDVTITHAEIDAPVTTTTKWSVQG